MKIPLHKVSDDSLLILETDGIEVLFTDNLAGNTRITYQQPCNPQGVIAVKESIQKIISLIVQKYEECLEREFITPMGSCSVGKATTKAKEIVVEWIDGSQEYYQTTESLNAIDSMVIIQDNNYGEVRIPVSNVKHISIRNGQW